MGLSRFFIDRPVFAWVIAIVIMLAGGIAAFTLPVEQYPIRAPPAVVVNTFYPGADAETLQNSVETVLRRSIDLGTPAQSGRCSTGGGPCTTPAARVGSFPSVGLWRS